VRHHHSGALFVPPRNREHRRLDAGPELAVALAFGPSEIRVVLPQIAVPELGKVTLHIHDQFAIEEAATDFPQRWKDLDRPSMRCSNRFGRTQGTAQGAGVHHDRFWPP
jgi:hypothetical protein